MLEGSSLCGSKKYVLEGPPLFLSYCHCSLCQKASGSVLLAALHTGARAFRWISGEQYLASFESTPDNDRYFSSNCGLNMPVVRGAHITIPAGTQEAHKLSHCCPVKE